MIYGISTKFAGTYEQAIEKVTAELQKEGFGVLTTIDVQATLKKKLGIDTDRYIILGACNPSFANQAIEMEPELGLLLPCNIIVYEKANAVTVSAFNPMTMTLIIDNPAIQPIAVEVTNRLARVIRQMKN